MDILLKLQKFKRASSTLQAHFKFALMLSANMSLTKALHMANPSKEILPVSRAWKWKMAEGVVDTEMGEVLEVQLGHCNIFWTLYLCLCFTLKSSMYIYTILNFITLAYVIFQYTVVCLTQTVLLDRSISKSVSGGQGLGIFIINKLIRSFLCALKFRLPSLVDICTVSLSPA